MNTSKTQFYTYMHCKPDLTPFYVGKGSGSRCYNFTHHRNAHYKNVVAKYGRENIQIIVTKKDSEESAFKSEIRLIKILRDAGFDLCNHTDGGEGPSGATRSEEYRAKMSASKMGSPAWNKGKRMSPESCLKMSAAKTGKKCGPMSAEQRAKISAAKLGKKHTVETKVKISAAGRGRICSLEARANMSAAKKGKPKSAAHRASMSAVRIGMKYRKKSLP